MLSRGRQLYRELVSIAVSEGFQLTEKALKKLEESENPVENLLRTIEELKKHASDVILIDAGHLKLQQTEEKPAGLKLQLVEEPSPSVIPRMTTVNLIEDDYRIEGEIFEFHRYFMDRYRKIRRILERRSRNYKPVAEALAARDGEEVEIAVMVLGREERKNSLILDVEDPSGIVRVVVPVKNQQIYREACELVNDVVVGMKVRKVGDLLILREAAYPDVEERQQRNNQTNPEAYVCLISDVHVGSRKFRQDLFEKFLDWVNRGRDGVVKRITHIVIAGDLVEGVGVYPGQEKDLMIKNVEDQLKEASKLLAEIPERMEVVFSPGNHEPVRKALPQPPLQKRYRDLVNKKRLVSFVSNPANLVFDGARILVYHGQGLDELIQSIPEASYSNLRETGPKLMSYMLKCRHLAPVYGENTPLLPMNEDRLVISETPNVFQTGHIHVVVKTNYKGVVLINSGAWQDQTEYQMSMGMEPMTGYAALYNLATHDVSVRKFGS
ncbi:MAG: metallophosphoesterase [Candidatus Caldarchaeum sp.]|nr:metallophosphoesterase [Candidatus Caldarchaeum sp.]